MPPPKLAPCFSFGRISPEAFIYAIIGNSELSSVRLPNARPDQAITNPHLRLLLRLKWISQALLRSTSAPHDRDAAPSVSSHCDDDTLLRLLGYACDISGAVSPDKDWNVEYPIQRRITLQLVASVVRLGLRSKTVWMKEQVDWVRVQIEEMVHGWSKRMALALVEASLVRELLTLLATATSPRGEADPIGLSSSSVSDLEIINIAFDDLLGLNPPSAANQSKSFWMIYDWLLIRELEVCQNFAASGVTLDVYREALSKFRARPDHHYSFPLATYLLEELALQVHSVCQLLPHEELIADNQLLNNMLRITSAEATSFMESFPEHVTLIEARHKPTDTHNKSLPPVPSHSNLSLSPVSPSRTEDQSPVTSPSTPQRNFQPHLFGRKQSADTQPTMQHSAAKVPIVTTSDTRAYRYPGPVELPTRKPTRRPLEQNISPLQGQSPADIKSQRMPPAGPQQAIPPIQIDGGLEVVEDAHFHSTSDFTKMMNQPQLGLHRLSVAPDGDTRSISNFSSIGSISSRSKIRLFSRFGGSKAPTVSPLPASLEFCFSNCAQQILFWCKKNPDSVIRLRHPFQHAERFEMLVPDSHLLGPNKTQNRSIRLFAAVNSVAIAVVHIEEARWLYILHNDSFQPLVALPDTTPPILSTCVSPDGSTISLGCGHFNLLYRLLSQQVSGPWRLDPNLNLGSRVVRLQRLSFSTDSRRLISAVQVEHSTHKHAVFISVWLSSGSIFRLEAQLDPVYLTVGYSDDTGISSIFLTGHSDSLAVQQAFLTAALSKSYPSILPIASGMRNQHLDIADKRIDGAVQCPVPTLPYLCAIRSGRNKICLVDTRTGTIEKFADFSAERKGLHLRHENVALGMQGPDTVYVMWRAEENLVLKTLVRGQDGKWGGKTMELGAIYRQAVGLS